MQNDENTPNFNEDETTVEDNFDTNSDGAGDADDSQDTTDWKTEAQKARADAAKYKAILDRNKDKSPESKPNTGELGYAEKGFLAGHGIKTESELDFFQNEFKASGFKKIEQLLGNKYFQASLQDFRDTSKTQAAVPNGTRGGTAATDSVDYWMNKPMEEIPKAMRIKVINAKMEKTGKKGVFYNS